MPRKIKPPPTVMDIIRARWESEGGSFVSAVEWIIADAIQFGVHTGHQQAVQAVRAAFLPVAVALENKPIPPVKEVRKHSPAKRRRR